MQHILRKIYKIVLSNWKVIICYFIVVAETFDR